jgi:hypothetical protein
MTLASAAPESRAEAAIARTVLRAKDIVTSPFQTKFDRYRKAPCSPDENRPSVSGTAANEAVSLFVLCGPPASFAAVGLFYARLSNWVAPNSAKSLTTA